MDHFFRKTFLKWPKCTFSMFAVIRMRKVAAGAKFWCRCKDMLQYQLKETRIESLTQITSSEWRPQGPRWRKKSSKFVKSLWKTGASSHRDNRPNCDPPHACVSRAVQRGLLPPHSNKAPQRRQSADIRYQCTLSYKPHGFTQREGVTQTRSQ